MTSVEAVPACLLAAAPVGQPPHLEGDPTLATEILPGPPSLLSIQQLGIPKRDHKKALVVASYLPPSDPGTTYGANTVSTMATTTDVDGPRRKRARLDKGSESSRAQRASARNMAAATTASDPAAPAEAIASSSILVPDSDLVPMQVDSDDADLSRSNSVQLGEEPESISSMRNSARRDKGKGKERAGGVRVKEEPGSSTIVASDAAALANASSNEDHCSACRSLGSLVYCDGCPRAYHLWCLNPPMEAEDLPAGDARWFCPSCSQQQKPPIKPHSGLKFMSPLVEQVESMLPAEYSLPQDIRTFFKDVATGPKGNYVDGSEVKQPRLNRHGQLEEREPYRLRDRNGEPVLCFRCGTSALPPDLAASAPLAKRARRETSPSSNTETGRSMISCDYCHLHWHLDCVVPPLAYMPPWNKKWMCPNHVEQVMPTKRRIPKTNAPPIEITKSNEYNNGNIEVIHPETPAPPPPRLAIDEVLINGRRYRVPERVITMDFWRKTGKQPSHEYHDYYDSSPMFSPLSSLSSLSDDEMDYQTPSTSVMPLREAKFFSSGSPVHLFDMDDLKAALSLCGMHGGLPQGQTKTGATLAGPAPTAAPKVIVKVHANAKASGSKLPNEALVAGVNETASAPVRSGAAPRRSGRSSLGRRLRPWNKTSIRGSSTPGLPEGVDDLSEDYSPSAAARRQKRDSAGKFIAKNIEAKAAQAASTLHPQAAPLASEVATDDAIDQSNGGSSSRSRRNRQPSRKSESPAELVSASKLIPEARVEPHVRKATNVKSASARAFDMTQVTETSAGVPTKNGASSTPRSSAMAPDFPAHKPQTNGTHNVPSIALNVPAPTTLHPSLRYKSLASTPTSVDNTPKSEVVALPKANPTTRHKPITPIPKSEHAASTSDAAPPASNTKTESTTPSTGLKIRLPRMGGALSSMAAAATNADQDSPSSSRSKVHKSSSSSRPRRSLRRQSSRSTSVTGTSLSSPTESSQIGGIVS